MKLSIPHKLETVPAVYSHPSRGSYSSKDRKYLTFSVSMLILGCITAIGLYSFAFGGTSLHDYYLLPWTFLLLVVVVLPSVRLIAAKRFSAFHPLVYAAWSYFLPAFVVGSMYYTFGTFHPYFTQFIIDPERTLPLTLLYITLGFAGLTLGYSSKVAMRIGKKLSRRTPNWDWSSDRLLRAAIIILILGQVLALMALMIGSRGYQYEEEAPVFGATIHYLSVLGDISSFWIWYLVFGKKTSGTLTKIAICLNLASILYWMVLGGDRGTLLRCFILAMGAFSLTRSRIRIRHGLAFSVLLFIALSVGMVYGTTFREIKGSEARVPVLEYYDYVKLTLDVVLSRSIGENLDFAVDHLLRRLENVTTVAVVISNYRGLAGEEENYGLANNIWTSTWTAFIPRFLWPEKPNVSGARAIGLLYFDYGDSSPAITPIADLLRNFGPFSIPLGMALIGIILRIIRSAFIENNRQLTPWRAVVYIMLLTSISYEGFYGAILPVMLRTAFILILAGFLVQLLTKRYTIRCKFMS